MAILAKVDSCYLLNIDCTYSELEATFTYIEATFYENHLTHWCNFANIDTSNAYIVNATKSLVNDMGWEFDISEGIGYNWYNEKYKKVFWENFRIKDKNKWMLSVIKYGLL
jgi:hypothetical protein